MPEVYIGVLDSDAFDRDKRMTYLTRLRLV